MEEVGPQVTVALLGPLEVRLDGAPVAVRGPVRQAVLARLAVDAGRPVPADVLAEDVWDGRPPGGWRATLQSHLSHLRKDLGAADVVRTTPSGYLLDVAPTAVDAARFARDVARARELTDPAARSDRLAAALAVWRGDALAGLHAAAWARNEAARLHEARLAAVEERVAADLLLGRHRHLVPELEALVREHPFHEGSWIQLMAALGGSGRHAEALRAAQRLRSLLAEIGLSPSPALVRAESAIASHDGEAAADPAPVVVVRPDRPASERAPLVGRGRELALLRDRSRSGGGRRVLLVSGEPGIGKTRLTEELADAVRAEGGTALAGRCESDLKVPLQPFAEILSQFAIGRAAEGSLGLDCFGRWPEELARIAPDLAWRLPDLTARPEREPDLGHYRALAALSDWVTATASAGRLLLVVEDVHWASRPTLQVVRHLAQEREADDAVVVVTLRDTEDLDPGVRQALAELRRTEGVELLPLDRLTVDDVGELFDRWDTARRSARDRDAWARDAWARSGGNPLFLGELVRHAVEQEEGPAAPTPQRLSELVDERLERLAPETVAVLERASVLGTEVDLLVLQRMVGGAEEDLLRALEEATRARLLEPLPGPHLAYSFLHSLVADVLYQRLSPARRAYLHRDAGLALERAGASGPGHLQRLFHHFARAVSLGDRRRAVEHGVAAGWDALDQGAPQEAADLFTSALGLVGDDDLRRADLLLGLGEARRRIPGADSRTCFLEAAEIARGVHDVEALGRAAKGISRGFVTLVGGADAERVALLEGAVAACGDDLGDMRVRLLTSLAGELCFQGERARADALTAEAVALARRVDDPSSLAHALATRWDVLFHPTTLDERTALAREMASLGPVGPDTAWRAGWAAFGCAVECADPDAAGEALDALVDAARTGEPRSRWCAAVARATWAVACGRPDEAEEEATAAVAWADVLGPTEVMAAYTAHLFQIRLQQGRVDDLLPLVGRAPVPLVAVRAAEALVLGLGGHQQPSAAIVTELAADGGRVLPGDQTWPFAVGVLAAATAVVGDPAAADLAAALLEPVGDQVLGHPTYALGPAPAALALASSVGARSEAERAALVQRADAALAAYGARTGAGDRSVLAVLRQHLPLGG